MQTSVVNLYKHAYDVYVGRPGKGRDGFFGNPFKGPDHEASIIRFKDYFYDRIRTDPEYRKRIIELRGKRLGCFCKPKSCHADIIAYYLDHLPETLPVKYGIIGSRSFQNYDFLRSILKWFDIKKVISGGATGADSLAKRYAEDNGLEYQEFPAEWERFGKKAGYIRNKQIVDASEEIIAFWDGDSPGTRNSLELADAAGKPMYIFWESAPNKFLEGLDI